jgi:hypothetical protein
MPADFFIDVPRGMVFSQGVGALGLAEALDHTNRLLAHPDFRPEFNQLADFRGATVTTLTHADVRELANRRVFANQSRRAFVVGTGVQYGLARTFGTLREFQGETGIQVFRELEPALQWLELPAEAAAFAFARLRAGFLQGQP